MLKAQTKVASAAVLSSLLPIPPSLPPSLLMISGNPSAVESPPSPSSRFGTINGRERNATQVHCFRDFPPEKNPRLHRLWTKKTRTLNTSLQRRRKSLTSTRPNERRGPLRPSHGWNTIATTITQCLLILRVNGRGELNRFDDGGARLSSLSSICLPSLISETLIPL